MNPRPQKSRMLNINFYKTRFFALSALFGFTISAYASMDLAYWNTNTVKSGQPWMQIDTKITSVNLDLEIDHGIVKTHATIEYMPSNGTVYNSGCGPSIVCVDTLNSKCIPSICESQSMSSVMDSLETNTSFQLEENTAINDMYLWVGNVRVRAALQERGLASAQYESIVQRRKDPALLETWGNGNYNLRIFPTQSGLKRKLEINFIQGLENNGGLMSTVLPFISSLYKINNPASLYADQGINKNIGEMSLNAISKDGLTYKLDWPGLGSGTVNARGLKLNAKNIEELKGGNISRNVNATLVACPNCLESWTAQKAGTSYFGVKALIDHKNLKLEAEPLERDIIVDVDDNDTLGPDRARKFALLALKAYAKAPYKGNLGFSDGKGKINFVFPNAVSMNATYLNIAYENLNRWVPVS